jgi:hypothetical protein
MDVLPNYSFRPPQVFGPTRVNSLVSLTGMFMKVRKDRTDEQLHSRGRRRGNNEKRRYAMGDKGGKKDKEKGQKQNAEKLKHKSQKKLDKQPKRKP